MRNIEERDKRGENEANEIRNERGRESERREGHT
jgi:hypothetical protein